MAPDGFRDSLAVARRETARSDLPSDDPYLQLMACYVELGELLESGRSDAWFEEACADLANELAAISRDQQEYDEQAFAVWRSRHAMSGWEVEGGQ